MSEVYILSAMRTPIGSFGGGLKDISATQLGGIAIEAAIKKAGIQPSAIDEVIMGCVLQAGLGQAPARQAAIFAGLPPQVVCTTVNKVCASGMKAVSLGAQAILTGQAQIVIAGGMESMSNVPFYADKMRWGHKYGNTQLADGLTKDGLTDAYNGEAMGVSGEVCAATYKITRDQQDAYAIESYKRSMAAWEKGLFTNEIAPVTFATKKGNTIIERDEEPFNVVFDKIPQLKPAFLKDGTITAANASTMNDGAAALVLISKEACEHLGLKPIAKIVGFADAEQEPQLFTTTPSLALPLAIKRAGLLINEIDYWEINEAFSVVSLANIDILKLNPSHVNVNGGAVSLGHPLGCSGARILVTLIHVLEQRQATLGAAGICNGGGGASAMVLERV